MESIEKLTNDTLYALQARGCLIKTAKVESIFNDKYDTGSFNIITVIYDDPHLKAVRKDIPYQPRVHNEIDWNCKFCDELVNNTVRVKKDIPYQPRVHNDIDCDCQLCDSLINNIVPVELEARQ